MKVACERELKAHRLNQIFTLVPCPKNCSLMGCRWVFTVNDNGLYQARLVAKGFTRIMGVNYQEYFSPLVGHSSLRLFDSHCDTEQHGDSFDGCNDSLFTRQAY